MDTFTLSLPVICIICFFVFLAGFVDAAAGGGGLISLPAYLATEYLLIWLMGAISFRVPVERRWLPCAF